MVARDLIKRGVGGAIVNVSSVTAHRLCGHKAPYSEYKITFKNSLIINEQNTKKIIAVKKSLYVIKHT